ncbi:MAG: response regulator [Microcystaceae cyanobacterium]
MKKILVVEDSKSDQMLISGLLKTLGAEVITMGNGESAIAWLKANSVPDLIFLDIIMPEMSGYDLCRVIRKDLGLDTVPIVFCSTKSEEYDKFWALRQGGNAYLTKPYLPNDLVNTAKSYLGS